MEIPIILNPLKEANEYLCKALRRVVSKCSINISYYWYGFLHTHIQPKNAIPLRSKQRNTTEETNLDIHPLLLDWSETASTAHWLWELLRVLMVAKSYGSWWPPCSCYCLCTKNFPQAMATLKCLIIPQHAIQDRVHRMIIHPWIHSVIRCLLSTDLARQRVCKDELEKPH